MSLPDISDPRIAAALAIYFGALILAALLGHTPERLGSLSFGAMFPIQYVLYNLALDPVFSSVDWVLVTADVIALAGLMAIALNADRNWSKYASALMLLAVLAHFIRAATPTAAFTYAQFNFVPTLLAILVLLVGATVHRVRRLRGHRDRNWYPYRDEREMREILAEDLDL
ncbi:MAG: hypothetical protein AAF494_00650 [Pseudomonadota bacterium]